MPSSRPDRRAALPRHLAAVLVLVAGLLALAPALSPTSVAAVGDDDYPSRLRSAAQDALVDPWLFYNRECTSFVAWRLNNDADVPFHNYYLGVHWGNASNWRYAARRVGIPVDRSPRVGAVAWWAAGSPGSSRGHVAWVMGRTSTSITVEEYNYLSAGRYDQRTISTSSSAWPSAFLHIGRRPLTNTRPPSIPGTPKVGSRLTARPGRWNIPGATLSYRWLADGVAITGATRRSFFPRAEQLGKRLQVRVTARIGAGPAVSATSASTAAVVPGVYRANARPTVSGTPQVGEPLTATRGRWAPAGATFAYQWLADGSPVDGATHRTFAPRAEQLGTRVRVQVTASGPGMRPGVAVSSSTDEVIPGELIPSEQPRITGTPRVDTRLSATRGTWSRRASYSYQWSADGKPVAGADTRTFAPTADQLGKRISVAVTASKAGYRTASSRSDVTRAVKPATFARTGPPIITGTAQVDRPLTVSAGDWSPTGKASFQWYLDGVPVHGATSTTFTPHAEHVRKQVSVKVTMQRAGYVTTSSMSAATAGVVPGTFQNTRAPWITGTPQVGVPLTLHHGGWSPRPTLSYQWLADGQTVAGATTTTFTPTAGQLGSHLTVQVTARRTGYLTALIETGRTREVAAGIITSLDRPVIIGKPYVGKLLQSSAGRWSVKPSTVSYQWYADGVAIDGATGSTYRPTAAELDHRLTVRVTALRDGYLPARRAAAPTAPVVRGQVVIDTAPTISGAALVGRVLTASPGRSSPGRATPSFTWLRGGKSIASATGVRYRLRPGDVGHRITVRVTSTAPHWASATARAVATPVVRAVPELDVAAGVRGHRVTLRFVVHAPGLQDPAGKIIVTEGGVRIGRVTVVDGRGRLVLRDVASGLHHYRFTYSGALQNPRGGRLGVTVP